MTNVEIIDANKQRLFAEGVLKGTGRMFEGVDMNGDPVMIPEVEQIHTFAGWKDLGYKVKKGEHAKARFSIWKHTSRMEEIPMKDGTKIEQECSHMFLKEACWFTREQVELIEAVG